MKKSLIVSIFLVFLLTLSFISSTTDASIFDDQLKIKIYNTSKQDYTGENLTNFKIEFTSQEDPKWNNKTFNFPLNLTKGLFYESVLFPYRVIITDTTENFDFWEELKDCEVDKGKLDISYTKCNLALEECKNQNLTNCSISLMNCNFNIKEKDLTISSKDEEINKLETEKESTKNNKFIGFGIGCLLGVLGALAYHGKIGTKAQDKSTTEFNRNQAG